MTPLPVEPETIGPDALEQRRRTQGQPGLGGDRAAEPGEVAPGLGLRRGNQLLPAGCRDQGDQPDSHPGGTGPGEPQALQPRQQGGQQQGGIGEAHPEGKAGNEKSPGGWRGSCLAARQKTARTNATPRASGM